MKRLLSHASEHENKESINKNIRLKWFSNKLGSNELCKSNPKYTGGYPERPIKISVKKILEKSCEDTLLSVTGLSTLHIFFEF